MFDNDGYYLPQTSVQHSDNVRVRITSTALWQYLDCVITYHEL